MIMTVSAVSDTMITTTGSSISTTNTTNDNNNNNNNNTTMIATSGTIGTGGIAWSGSLVGSQNPNISTHGYRYSTISKRYKYNNNNNSNHNHNNMNGDNDNDDTNNNIELPNHIQIQFQQRNNNNNSTNNSNDDTNNNTNQTSSLSTSTTFDIPITSTTNDLQLILNELQQQNNNDNNDNHNTTSSSNNNNKMITPYAFYIQIKTPNTTTPNDNNNNNEESTTTTTTMMINEIEITNTIRDILLLQQQQNHTTKISTESIITISYIPLSIYKVRPITRCTNTLHGHTNAVLYVTFNTIGTLLCTGGGDTLIRIWDVYTNTTKCILQGHRNHILCISWSIDNQYIVSGDKSGTIIVWDPYSNTNNNTNKGNNIVYQKQIHTKYITGIVWEPMHLCTIPPDHNNNNSSNTNNTDMIDDDDDDVTTTNPSSKATTTKKKKNKMNGSKQYDLHICQRFASCSRDTTIKIWNIKNKSNLTLEYTLSGHTDSIECIKWSGEQYIISGSRDRTIKVWNPNRGILIRTLIGHGHRINTLALSSDSVIKYGPYDYQNTNFTCKYTMLQKAKDKYNIYKQQYGIDTLVSGSDDYTIYMWNYENNKNPIKRLIGHQQIINHIQYSYDGRYIISSSFDKKIKIWDGMNGNYLCTLHGHVGPVYQSIFSYDSKYILSVSKDTTIKLWDISSILQSTNSTTTSTSNTNTNITNCKSAKMTLSGHEDEIYTIDWNPITSYVATGSKDRTIKIWKH